MMYRKLYSTIYIYSDIIAFSVSYLGNGLGPVHRSTGPVEILPRVQKLYKTKHVAESQRIHSCTEPNPYPHIYYLNSPLHKFIF